MDGRSAGFFQGLLKFFWETFPFWFPGGRLFLFLLTVALLVVGLAGGAWDVAAPVLGISLMVVLILLPFLDWWFASPPPLPWEGWKIPSTLDAVLQEGSPEACWQKGTVTLWASIEQELLVRGNAASSELVWLERTLFYLTANQLFQVFECMKDMTKQDLLVMLKLLAARPWIHAEVLRAILRSNLLDALAALVGEQGGNSAAAKDLLERAKNNLLLNPPDGTSSKDVTTRLLLDICSAEWYDPTLEVLSLRPLENVQPEHLTPRETDAGSTTWLVRFQGKECWNPRPFSSARWLTTGLWLLLRHFLLFYLRLKYWRILPRKWVLRFNHHNWRKLEGVLSGVGVVLGCVWLIRLQIPIPEVKLSSFECRLSLQGDSIEFWKWRIFPTMKTDSKGAFLVITEGNSLPRDCMWPVNAHTVSFDSARRYPVLVILSDYTDWLFPEQNLADWIRLNAKTFKLENTLSSTVQRGIFSQMLNPEEVTSKSKNFGPLDLSTAGSLSGPNQFACQSTVDTPRCGLYWPIRLMYAKLIFDLQKITTREFAKIVVSLFAEEFLDEEQKSQLVQDFDRRFEPKEHQKVVELLDSLSVELKNSLDGVEEKKIGTRKLEQARSFYNILLDKPFDVAKVPWVELLTQSTRALDRLYLSYSHLKQNNAPCPSMDQVRKLLIKRIQQPELTKHLRDQLLSTNDADQQKRRVDSVNLSLESSSFLFRLEARALTRCLVAGQAQSSALSAQKSLADLEDTLYNEVYTLPTNQDELSLRDELATLILAQAIFEWLNLPDVGRRLQPELSPSVVLYPHTEKGLTLRLEAAALALAMQRQVEKSRQGSRLAPSALWEQAGKLKEDPDPYRALLFLAREDPVQLLLRYGVSELPMGPPTSTQGAPGGGSSPGLVPFTPAPTPSSSPGPAPSP